MFAPYWIRHPWSTAAFDEEEEKDEEEEEEKKKKRMRKMRTKNVSCMQMSMCQFFVHCDWQVMGGLCTTASVTMRRTGTVCVVNSSCQYLTRPPIFPVLFVPGIRMNQVRPRSYYTSAVETTQCLPNECLRCPANVEA